MPTPPEVLWRGAARARAHGAQVGRVSMRPAVTHDDIAVKIMHIWEQRTTLL